MDRIISLLPENIESKISESKIFPYQFPDFYGRNDRSYDTTIDIILPLFLYRMSS